PCPRHSALYGHAWPSPKVAAPEGCYRENAPPRVYPELAAIPLVLSRVPMPAGIFSPPRLRCCRFCWLSLCSGPPTRTSSCRQNSLAALPLTEPWRPLLRITGADSSSPSQASRARLIPFGSGSHDNDPRTEGRAYACPQTCRRYSGG